MTTIVNENGDRERIAVKHSHVATATSEALRDVLLYSNTVGSWLARGESGAFERIDDESVSSLMLNLLARIFEASGFSEGFYKSTLSLTKTYMTFDAFTTDSRFLPLRNGVLIIDEMRLVEYKKEVGGKTIYNDNFVFNWHLPYSYDPDADCPVFKSWLLRLDKSVAEYLRAYFYAILSGMYRLQIYRFLSRIGARRNG